MKPYQEDLLTQMGFDKIRVGLGDFIFERNIKIFVTGDELRGNDTELATSRLLYLKLSKPEQELAQELINLRPMAGI